MKRIFGLILFAVMALSLSAVSLANDNCRNCGRIVNIESVVGHRSSNGGALAGAIVGGAIGNQVGDGNGQTAARVAGAVGGAYVGREIAQNSEKMRFRVTVKMLDGRVLVRTQDKIGNMRIGSQVRVKDGRVRPR